MNTFRKKMNGGTVLISFLLVLIMTLTPLFLFDRAKVYGEGNPQLINPDFSIVDGEDDDGNLIHTEPVTIRVSFGVPVRGDGGNHFFEQGDVVELLLSEYFFFNPVPGGSIDLIDTEKNVLIGHVTLGNNANNQAIATITFDGDERVFDGYYEQVSAEFDATLIWNGETEEDDEGNQSVRILEKTVDFLFPGDTITYTMEKTGIRSEDGNSIRWTVVVTAFSDRFKKGEEGYPDYIDLKGYDFVDDLSEVGSFVSGSFSRDSSLEPDGEGLLTYTFPEGSMSPQTVTFDTAISDSTLTTGGTVSNTAHLKKDGKPFKFDEGSVTIPAPVFTKSGVTGSPAIPNGSGNYNPNNQTITWTVEVDSKGRLLSGLAITDTLASGLAFESAEWQVYTGGDPPWSPAGPATTWYAIPENNRYYIGNFNGHGRLVIVTKAPTPTSGVVVGTTTYENQATVTWTGTGGTTGSVTTNKPGVQTGYNAITKSAGTVDMTNHRIPWTVEVKLHNQGTTEQLAALTIYDLIVHEAATSDTVLTAAVTTAGGSTPAWPTGLAIGSGGVARNNGQKYVAGSLAAAEDSDHLTVTAIELYSGTNHIGTLIKATGLKNDTTNSIQFTTQVLNPAILAGNNTTASPAQVVNTATLTSGTSRIGTAVARKNFMNQILSKELLHRDQVGNDYDSEKSINANNKTTNANDGFHYGYKEAIFRFNINAAGLDFENGETTLTGGFGPVTVTDTLPEGWEFVPFENGDDFLLYNGGTFQSGGAYPATGSLVAAGYPIDLGLNTGIVSANFNRLAAPQTAVFTFTGLKTPYVLLVKARLTAETLDGYLVSNDEVTETNTLNLKSTNWTPGKTVTQNIVVDGKVLEKTLFVDDNYGLARWTVEYTPLDQPVDISLVDTLPPGIDLRTDSSGNLVWFDGNGDRNITVTELILDAAGNYVPGEPISQQDHEEYISYNPDPDKRELEFTFPDNTKGYRLEYLTDITGSPGYISNKVRLISERVAGVTDEKGFNILASHGSATMRRSAFVIINKTASDGLRPLSGAQFTLYHTDDEGKPTSVRAEKETDADGSLSFYGLPEGQLILQETKPPEGFEPNDTLYIVTVGADRSVTVDGRVHDAQHPLTIRNFTTKEVLGDLTLRKIVAGNAGDPDALFTFTIHLLEDGGEIAGVFNYLGFDGAPNGTISSGGKVYLKDGQWIGIFDLPEGIDYVIEEDEADPGGYVITSEGAEGVISDEEQSNAIFTNTRNLGELTIKKTVDGISGDKNRKFTFAVTLTDAEGEEVDGKFAYEGQGVENGEIASGGTIGLADGESIIIRGLPIGSSYTVLEREADKDDYITTATGDTGSFALDDFEKTAQFINSRNLGELTIKKTVNGVSGDKSRKFTFEVTLTDPDGQAVAGKFTYEGQGVEDGEIASGGTVKLAHGESIVIRDLPVGSSYTVVELEADEDDYITTPIGDKGSFELDDLRKTAQFINTNNSAVEGDEDIPKTGDATNILWLALFVISLTLLIVLKGADTYIRRERSTR